MLVKQFRITHAHLNKNHIKIHGKQISRLKTQPHSSFIPKRYANHSPEVQGLSSFRQSKRYDSIDYQGKIRKKIINHQSCEKLQENSNPQSMTVRLPKLVVTQSPVKVQTLSIKKDFVLNFYKKAKHIASRRKKLLQNAMP